MAKYDFSIHYDGNALKDNRIPVRDLAPSLIALSESFQNIQKIVNPNEAPLSLDIKATNKGSFIADLILTNGPDLISKAVDFLSGKESSALVNLVTYVTIFGESIKLITQLYKKKIKVKEETNNGHIKLILDDDSEIIISKQASIRIIPKYRVQEKY